MTFPLFRHFLFPVLFCLHFDVISSFYQFHILVSTSYLLFMLMFLQFIILLFPLFPFLCSIYVCILLVWFHSLMFYLHLCWLVYSWFLILVCSLCLFIQLFLFHFYFHSILWFVSFISIPYFHYFHLFTFQFVLFIFIIFVCFMSLICFIISQFLFTYFCFLLFCLVMFISLFLFVFPFSFRPIDFWRQNTKGILCKSGAKRRSF